MANMLLEQLPNQGQIQRKLATAHFHRITFDRIGDRQTEDGRIAAEACVCGTINQLLDALAATLHGFNLLLPDPLPPLRVNRKNLRDRFHAIQGDSKALRVVEDAARVNQGWLWWLEQKAAASQYFPLVAPDPGARPGELRLWRNPLNRTAGFEDGTPDLYLATSTDRIQALIQQVASFAPGDAIHYREASRTQLRRLL